MASTTKDNVILIAPEFAGDAVSDDLWDLVLADADNEISEKEFAKGGIEIIQRYWVAHTLKINTDSDVDTHKSEKIGTASISNYDDPLMRTKYGQEVVRLKTKWRKIGGF